MAIHRTKRRNYRRITPDVIAKHKATALLVGNGTQAVEELEPDYRSPKDRAYHIAKKSENQSPLEYIDASLQQIGIAAVQRVSQMVNSEDESIATRNSHYVIDQIKGKAVQKSVNLTAKINVQSVLD